jgi:hypothetical protein
VAAYRALNIVVIGNFNPAIFHPTWFRDNDLLPATEIESALESNLVVSAKWTQVQFDSLRLVVIQDRWLLETERVDWFTDLAVITRSIFDALSHTPMTIFGVNLMEHLKKRDGQRLLEKWVPLAALGSVIGKNAKPGARIGAEWEEYRTSIQLEPSVKLDDGIFLAQNFERKVKNANELTARLSSDWPKMLQRAKHVRDTIMEPSDAGAN